VADLIEPEELEWGGAWLVSRVADGKFIRGKDGWLFLANDVNHVLDQHSGALRLDPENLERWRELLDSRVASLEQRGTPYLFVVAPDTHSVYPERLPSSFVPASSRPVHQLMDHLAETGTRARVAYLLDELVAGKDEQQTCSSFDTHWTDFGAFLAYERVIDELGDQVAVRRLTREDVSFVAKTITGDLAVKLGIDEAVQLCALMIPEAQVLYDNRVANAGSLVVLECSPAPSTTCLLFADSYGSQISQFLAESFGRFVFAYSTGLDYELIEREQPDVVVSLMAERFLIKPPTDSVSIAALAADKIARGRTRPPLPYWRAEGESEAVVVPVEAVERIRAELLAAGDVRSAAMVGVLAYAGLRPSELGRIRWRDVGPDAIEVVTFGARTHRARLVRLLKPLREDLETWRAASESAGGEKLVFPTGGGTGWREGGWRKWRERVYRPASEASEAAGTVPDQLRHTLADLLLGEHAGIESVAEQIGADVHLSLKAYRELASRLEAAPPRTAEERIRHARGRR
jgi:alginate O-acetyltransferase complex protein AlgJ